MKEHDVPKRDEIVELSLEGYVPYQESFECLKNMSNKKSPESDRLKAEFFKVFWSKVGHFVVRSTNFGYERGELLCTQKQGIITCIPTCKEGKNKFQLIN